MVQLQQCECGRQQEQAPPNHAREYVQAAKGIAACWRRGVTAPKSQKQAEPLVTFSSLWRPAVSMKARRPSWFDWSRDLLSLPSGLDFFLAFPGLVPALRRQTFDQIASLMYYRPLSADHTASQSSPTNRCLSPEPSSVVQELCSSYPHDTWPSTCYHSHVFIQLGASRSLQYRPLRCIV